MYGHTPASPKPQRSRRRSLRKNGPGICAMLRLRALLPDSRRRSWASAKSASTKAGKLQVPWGYAAGVQCDPIEKKPFHHAYPGALAYSFGMLGCDLHCAYCQNWVTSQAIRDPRAISRPMHVTAGGSGARRRRQGAKVLVSTYNEPLITSEWAVAVFKEAKARGADHRLRLQRQWHAAGARIPAPLGGSLQSRSEELRRPPLSRNSADASSPFFRPFAACTKWVCGWRLSRC